jgi:membrane-bound lytic murein transglycosylase D
MESLQIQAAEQEKSRISKSEIQNLLEQSPAGDFPLELTPPVMARLNFLLAQEEQAEGVKQELNRMDKYRPLILSQLEKADMPLELAAIPMVETGYRNHPPHRNGTGLWMLTKPTAEAYDLTVANKNDERMNPEKATEAAIQILKDYYERFDDWLLALAAYNQGPTYVANVIRQTESRDGWELMEQGHLNNYAAKIIAAAIIIEHQEALLSDSY